MKRVIFTASTYSHIRNFHRPYLQRFRELGWEVHVACGGPELPIPEADACFTLPFEKKITALKNFRAERMLRTLMERNDYALICTHTSLAAFFTRRAAAALSPRPPLVNVVHGYLFDEQTPRPKKALLLRAEKMTAAQTDLLLTMNDWDFAEARRAALAERIGYIPGIGIDCGRFRRFDGSREEFRAQLGLAPADLLLLYAAEFSDRKNQEFLIRAMRLLPENIRLALPGDGGELARCRALAQSLGLADRVIFPGYQSDMPLWYASADIAVSSSRSEGLPFNILEAMCCALPVVASAVKGHTDLVEGGVTGLLYDLGDEVGFVRDVGALAASPALRRSLAEAALERLPRYEIENVLPQVMAAYLSVSVTVPSASIIEKEEVMK